VIFLGVGFETTAPAVAVTVRNARKRRIENFFVLSGHRLIPPAIEALLKTGQVRIDGFILPGHVSTIIGAAPYEFIPGTYGLPCVIAGFEILDILEAILNLLLQKTGGKKPEVAIQYTRCVRYEGNKKARRVMQEVFQTADSEWRGLSIIPSSGLQIKNEFKAVDAEKRFRLKIEQTVRTTGCICGEVLQGIKIPPECRLFGKRCTPEDPVGPCMVSSEGTCAAYYKYH
jgi:hydrogenase expression/formation protein HypD